MMNISDMVGDQHAPEKKPDFMNLRKLQPIEGANEKLLSLQAKHATIDNLIRGLVDLLPKPDGIWPLEDRAKWLRLAAGIIDLGYKAGDGEQREIAIAVVRTKVANQIGSMVRDGA